MKWKAHTRTAERVLKVFGAMHFDKYEQDLINGVISPDNEDKKNHYIGREQTALEYLLRARKKRLAYDTPACFFNLGVAFHYIQDMWTGIGPDYEDHGLYLDLINRCDILDVHESLERYFPVRRKRVLDQFRALEKRLGKTVESESELKELVTMRRPYESSAFLDLNLSFRVCYRIAEMVLKTMYNVGLQESLELVHNEFVEEIKDRDLEAQKTLDSLEMKVGELALDDSTVNRINRWNFEKKLDSARQEYEMKKHLDQTLKNFNVKITQLCKSYENWYNIDIPKLDPEKILIKNIKPKSVIMNNKTETIKIHPEIDYK
jgi:hypothetical protein